MKEVVLGVLLNPKDDNKKLISIDAVRRPKTLKCDIHRLTISGEKWIVLVGLFDDKPYEVFSGLSDKIEIPRKYEHGLIIKNPRKINRSIYNLCLRRK